MDKLLKNIFLAGIGTMAMTYEKSTKLVADLVDKGKITVDQGKELNQELKRVINDEKDTESTTDFATKEDIDNLNKRIDELVKLQKTEKKG